MHPGSSWAIVQRTIAKQRFRGAVSFRWPRDFSRLGVTLAMYGLATALLLNRAPSVLGNRWSWTILLAVPALTLLLAGVRTGTALALVLVYSFVSASLMAVRAYQLGSGEILQLENILSHFATVFFLASAVALVSLLRSEHAKLLQAEELIRRTISEDEQSGLLSPAAFETAVAREAARSRRTSRPFLVLAVDARDYFRPALQSSTIANAEKVLGKILVGATRTDFDVWASPEPGLYLGMLAETDERAVDSCLPRMIARLRTTPEFDGEALMRSMSYGFAQCLEGEVEYETLVANALARKQALFGLQKGRKKRGGGKPGGRENKKQTAGSL